MLETRQNSIHSVFALSFHLGSQQHQAMFKGIHQTDRVWIANAGPKPLSLLLNSRGTSIKLLQIFFVSVQIKENFTWCWRWNDKENTELILHVITKQEGSWLESQFSWSLSVCSLYVLPMYMWVFSRYLDFPPTVLSHDLTTWMSHYYQDPSTKLQLQPDALSPALAPLLLPCAGW